MVDLNLDIGTIRMINSAFKADGKFDVEGIKDMISGGLDGLELNIAKDYLSQLGIDLDDIPNSTDLQNAEEAEIDGKSLKNMLENVITDDWLDNNFATEADEIFALKMVKDVKDSGILEGNQALKDYYDLESGSEDNFLSKLQKLDEAEVPIEEKQEILNNLAQNSQNLRNIATKQNKEGVLGDLDKFDTMLGDLTADVLTGLLNTDGNEQEITDFMQNNIFNKDEDGDGEVDVDISDIKEAIMKGDFEAMRGATGDIAKWMAKNFKRRGGSDSINSSTSSMMEKFGAEGAIFGDCEDPDILAASMLKALGVPEKDININITTGNKAEGEFGHSELSVTIDGQTAVIDFDELNDTPDADVSFTDLVVEDFDASAKYDLSYNATGVTTHGDYKMGVDALNTGAGDTTDNELSAAITFLKDNDIGTSGETYFEKYFDESSSGKITLKKYKTGTLTGTPKLTPSALSYILNQDAKGHLNVLFNAIQDGDGVYTIPPAQVGQTKSGNELASEVVPDIPAAVAPKVIGTIKQQDNTENEVQKNGVQVEKKDGNITIKPLDNNTPLDIQVQGINQDGDDPKIEVLAKNDAGAYEMIFRSNYDLEEGKMVTIEGTDENDNINVLNCVMDNLDLKNGKDTVSMVNSSVSKTLSAKGDANIYFSHGSSNPGEIYTFNPQGNSAQIDLFVLSGGVRVREDGGANSQQVNIYKNTDILGDNPAVVQNMDKSRTKIEVRENDKTYSSVTTALEQLHPDHFVSDGDCSIVKNSDGTYTAQVLNGTTPMEITGKLTFGNQKIVITNQENSDNYIAFGFDGDVIAEQNGKTFRSTSGPVLTEQKTNVNIPDNSEVTKAPCTPLEFQVACAYAGSIYSGLPADTSSPSKEFFNTGVVDAGMQAAFATLSSNDTTLMQKTNALMLLNTNLVKVAQLEGADKVARPISQMHQVLKGIGAKMGVPNLSEPNIPGITPPPATTGGQTSGNTAGTDTGDGEVSDTKRKVIAMINQSMDENIGSIEVGKGGKAFFSTIGGIAKGITGLYNVMLDVAQQMTGNEDLFKDPGALFLVQTKLQMLKDAIAALTAMGKSVGDTVSEAVKSFTQAVRQL